MGDVEIPNVRKSGSSCIAWLFIGVWSEELYAQSFLVLID